MSLVSFSPASWGQNVGLKTETYTVDFVAYGTMAVTVTGQNPALHCEEKMVGSDYYFLLPHCSQRSWEDGGLSDYKIITTFVPGAGWQVVGGDTVTVDYKLPKKVGGGPAEPHDMVVAEFELVLIDEDEEDREPEETIIRVIFQTPTIELSLHSPGTLGAKGNEIVRPDAIANDAVTVDGQLLEHGYVCIMQVNGDNDDGDPLPEAPGAELPRDNDDKMVGDDDDDLVAIKLELKQPDDFKFKEEIIRFKIPDHVRIFGSDGKEIEKVTLETGVSLEATPDGGFGDLVENKQVMLFAEGMGQLDTADAFNGGEVNLELLDGSQREFKAGGYLPRVWLQEIEPETGFDFYRRFYPAENHVRPWLMVPGSVIPDNECELHGLGNIRFDLLVPDPWIAVHPHHTGQKDPLIISFEGVADGDQLYLRVGEKARVLDLAIYEKKTITVAPHAISSTNDDIDLGNIALGEKSEDGYLTFIEAGPNGVISTKHHPGDRLVFDGPPVSINTGFNRIRETDTPPENIEPQNIPSSEELEEYLNLVFGRQANIYFKVLPVNYQKVDYDIGDPQKQHQDYKEMGINGVLDYQVGDILTSEEKVLQDNAFNKFADFNLYYLGTGIRSHFVFNGGTYITSNPAGFARQREGVAKALIRTPYVSASGYHEKEEILWISAHEIAHIAFPGTPNNGGLKHSRAGTELPAALQNSFPLADLKDDKRRLMWPNVDIQINPHTQLPSGLLLKDETDILHGK